MDEERGIVEYVSTGEGEGSGHGHDDLNVAGKVVWRCQPGVEKDRCIFQLGTADA